MTEIAKVESDFDYEANFHRQPACAVGTTAGPKGLVYVGVTEQDFAHLAAKHTVSHYSPDKARELAVRILDAADVAEQELLGRHVTHRQLELSFERRD
ncbi:MAG TPA: hypothetical protein VHO01_16445 [Jatrophihabitans sp.]|nr:hypothetical protein [Jatrophihabitans sp.]